MLYGRLIERIAFLNVKNIARIEFYLQGLLPKIFAIYTIKLASFSSYIQCRADRKLSLANFLDLLPYKRFILDSSTFMALPLLCNLTAKTALL